MYGLTPTNLPTGHIAVKIEMRHGELRKWFGSVNAGRVWKDDHCEGLWLCIGVETGDRQTPEIQFMRFQRPPGLVRSLKRDGTVEDFRTRITMPHADLIYGMRPSACKSGVTLSELRACPWTIVDGRWVPE